jgi:hypothetical protein
MYFISIADCSNGRRGSGKYGDGSLTALPIAETQAATFGLHPPMSSRSRTDKFT